MPSKQMGVFDPRSNPAVDALQGSITVGNPLDALLPADKLAKLAQLPAEQKNAYYGKVLTSVFDDPAYQQLVFDKANREFDNMIGTNVSSSDLSRVVEEVVKQVLRNRNQ